MGIASRLVAGLTMGAALTVAVSAAADPVADFYKGRTIDLIIAYKPGGGYDAYARLAGRHIGRHIPGNPQVVPQNMPLAGGLKAANYLYEIAKRDGSVIGLIPHNVMEQQVLGAEGIAYHAEKFNWIGRLNVINEAEIVWLASGVRTIDDAFEHEVVLGASGPTATPTVYPKVLNAIIGTKFKIVTGYSGAPESCLAMEKGEVQGCLLDLGLVKTAKRAWMDEKKIGVLFQMENEPDPMFPNVPTYASLGKTEQDRQALAVYSISAGVGRSIMAPPSVPAPRVAALRTAFEATVKDPAFLTDAAKAKLELNPASGTALQKMVEDAANVPPSAIARAKAAMK